MRSVERAIEIAAPPEAVWEVLSDLTAMSHYMSGVSRVEVTTAHRHGPGATRYCTFDDGIELEERVVSWLPGVGYVLETITAVGVPIRENTVQFRLAGTGEGTEVRQRMEFSMRGGVFAPLLERLSSSRMEAALEGALRGLKDHVESRRS